MSLTPTQFYWLQTQQIVPPWPPIPTRAQVIAFQGSMQGLTVQTSYGLTPYYEGVLAWFNAADRQAIYAAKHAKGDTHCGVGLSGAYKEPDQFYQNFPGMDWTEDLAGLLALLTEVIQAGFFPWVPLAGDGLVPDPVGLTYGHDWLMANLGRILTALEPVIPYTLWSPGYDGIIGYNEQQFGPWSPDQVSRYLVKLRQLAPECYSSIEPSAGPLGGRLPEFLTPAAYDALDCVLNEFNSPPNDDVTWQTADRILGPAFVRPPDMPPDDDPWAPSDGPQWRLRTPTSRGMIQAVAFEVCTYEAVRGMPLAEQQQQVAYVKACGYPTTG